MNEPLHNKPTQVRFISGKGGVGKTSIAAAWALAASRQNLRTLLVEMHGREQTRAMLPHDCSNLEIMSIQPAEAMREYAMMILRIESLYHMVFENKWVQRLLRLIPSLGELVCLGKIWYHAQEARFDLIVVDMHATGHAIAAFAAAHAVAQAIPAGLMYKNAQLIHNMLTNTQQTSLHIVTTPEHMPISESMQLIQAAQQLGMRVGPVIINQYQAVLSEHIIDVLPDDHSNTAVALLKNYQQQAAHGMQAIQQLPPDVVQHALMIPRIVLPAWGTEAIEKLTPYFLESDTTR